MHKFPLARLAARRTLLLSRLPQVVEAFLNLNKPYQAAIAEVTMKMGAGMAEFITKEARLERTPLSAHARAGVIAR